MVKKTVRQINNRRLRLLAVVLVCIMAFFTLCDTAFGAAGYEDVASSTQFKDTMREGMEPIYADQLNDGVYEIDVLSSSSFFKVMGATLTVSGGEMNAELRLYSNSYSCIYMGTGDEASDAPESDYVFVEDNGTDYVVTIPVEALSTNISCATFSKRKHKWYDRFIVFDASTLPDGALKEDIPAYGDFIPSEGGQVARDDFTPEAVAVDLKDGEYSVECMLVGGSGRASVSSPTWLYVEDGRAYAKLLWSSTYYDYMIIGDQTYYNETTDGSNSTFTIPITAFDEEMKVIADTTAMGDPVEIEYKLTFYYDTIGSKGMVPQEAAKRVLILAFAIIVIGGILNIVVKKVRNVY